MEISLDKEKIIDYSYKGTYNQEDYPNIDIVWFLDELTLKKENEIIENISKRLSKTFKIFTNQEEFQSFLEIFSEKYKILNLKIKSSIFLITSGSFAKRLKAVFNSNKLITNIFIYNQNNEGESDYSVLALAKEIPSIVCVSSDSEIIQNELYTRIKITYQCKELISDFKSGLNFDLGISLINYFYLQTIYSLWNSSKFSLKQSKDDFISYCKDNYKKFGGDETDFNNITDNVNSGKFENKTIKFYTRDGFFNRIIICLLKEDDLVGLFKIRYALNLLKNAFSMRVKKWPANNKLYKMSFCDENGLNALFKNQERENELALPLVMKGFNSFSANNNFSSLLKETIAKDNNISSKMISLLYVMELEESDTNKFVYVSGNNRNETNNENEYLLTNYSFVKIKSIEKYSLKDINNGRDSNKDNIERTENNESSNKKEKISLSNNFDYIVNCSLCLPEEIINKHFKNKNTNKNENKNKNKNENTNLTFDENKVVEYKNMLSEIKELNYKTDLFYLVQILLELNRPNNALQVLSTIPQIKNPNNAILFSLFASTYHILKEFDLSIYYYNQSLELRLHKFGLNQSHLSIANLFNDIGTVYSDKNEYNLAIESHGKSLKMYISLLGQDHPYTASILNNLGNAYSNQGDNNKAIEHYHKALLIKAKTLGSEHFEIAVLYLLIGGVHRKNRNFEMALENYNLARIIFEKNKNENDNFNFYFYNAKCYNYLGGVYNNLRDYNRAIDYYKKSLVFDEIILGPNHPYVADIHNNIGLAYYSKESYLEAIDHYHKALSIKKIIFLGKDHQDIATIYNNIGTAYNNKEEFEKAIEFYYLALGIDKRTTFGVNHLYAATTYNNLGLAFDNKKDFDKALEYFNQALEIQEEVLTKNHETTATSYNNIGGVYRSQENYDKAVEYFSKALTMYEIALGANHPFTAKCYRNMARVYKSKGDLNKAREYYNRGLGVMIISKL